MFFLINKQKYEYNNEYINNNNEFKISLIEFCFNKGYKIPHYCYHKELSIAGNCRMCLIELKNSPKPIVSCALSTKTSLINSEIFTNSPLVKKSRENVLEFLLLNHPLDCPICDQGGECDLQDQALFFGFGKKRFYNYKKTVTNKNLGAIVKTVMTRCICCTRCVRFACEIAGVKNLGVLGRGVKSEIGNYIKKVFLSELSGNIIDLCPVGALTSKPYPFIVRNWEIKQINTIDFTDGFGLNIQVFIKNNLIIKILPGFNKFEKTNFWISDKTRFSFDGMFYFQNKLTKKSFSNLFWNNLFEELTYIIYCKDFLIRHYLKVKYLFIIFSNNTSIEVLSLLLLISNKYYFLKLKKFENSNVNNDLESNFILNSLNKKTDFSLSNICLFLLTNPRYEGSYLNLKLRKRFLKGNFKFFLIGSLINLTYPVNYLGSCINAFKNIVEGNHIICQDFKNSPFPILICGAEIFKRKDSVNFIEFLENLKLYSNFFKKNWDGINILNNTLNDVGSQVLSGFNIINEKDLKNSFGIYLLNINFINGNLKKIIELKLLNFFEIEKNINYIFLEQNNKINYNLFNKIKQIYTLFNYKNLPNKTFFESNGTFINTEGIYKKTIKIVTSLQNLKEDWQIIRKFSGCISKIIFLHNKKINKKLHYNSRNLYDFKNYINFHYYSTNSLNNFTFNSNIKLNSFNLSIKKFKLTSKKIQNTKLKFWIEDFYLGGKDHYSQFSPIMIECSEIFRLETTNFF